MDLKRFETTGDSFSVAEQVSGGQGALGEIAVSTSRTGHTGLIAYRAPISDPRQLIWAQIGVGGVDEASAPIADRPLARSV